MPLLVVLEARSDPARSTSDNFEVFISVLNPWFFSLDSTVTCRIPCDLDDVSLAPVASLVLLRCPTFNNELISMML